MGLALAPNCCCSCPGFTRIGATFLSSTWLLVERLHLPYGSIPFNVPCWCTAGDDAQVFAGDPALHAIIPPSVVPPNGQALADPYTLLGYDQVRNAVIAQANQVYRIDLETCVGGTSHAVELIDLPTSNALLLDGAGGDSQANRRWFGSYVDRESGEGRILGVSHHGQPSETRVFSVAYDGTGLREEVSVSGLRPPSHSDDRIYLHGPADGPSMRFGTGSQALRPSWVPFAISASPNGLWMDGTGSTEPPDIVFVARSETNEYSWYYFPFAYGFDPQLQAACVYWYRHGRPVEEPPYTPQGPPPPSYIASFWAGSLQAGNIVGQEGVLFYLTQPRYTIDFGTFQYHHSHYGGQYQQSLGASGVGTMGAPTVMIPGRMPLPLELIDGNVFVGPPDQPPEVVFNCADLVDCDSTLPLHASLSMDYFPSFQIAGQTDGISEPINGQTFTLQLEYNVLNGGAYSAIEVQDPVDLPVVLRPFYAGSSNLQYFVPLGESGNHANAGRRHLWYEYDDPLYKHEEFLYGILITLNCSDGKVTMPNEMLFAHQVFRGHEGTVGSWPTQVSDGVKSIIKASDTNDPTRPPLETPGVPLDCSTTGAQAYYQVSFDFRDLALQPLLAAASLFVDGGQV